MAMAAKCKQLSFLDNPALETIPAKDTPRFRTPAKSAGRPSITTPPSNKPVSPTVAAPRSPSEPLRVSDVLQDYKKYLGGGGHSPYTVDGFYSDIQKLATFAPDRPLAQWDTAALREFLASQRTDGRTRRKGATRKEGSAETTVYRLHTSLRNFFLWLHEEEKKISTNPAESLFYKRPEPPEPVILTEQEADRFMEASGQTPQEHVISLLLLGAGLKRGELLSLELSKVNISDRLKPVVKIEGKHAREVILPLDFAAAYRQYISSVQPHAVIGGVDGWSGSPDELLIDPEEKWVFGLTDRTLTYLIDRIAARAGIHKKVSCETLKHSFAVLQLRAGNKIDEDIKRVFAMLGLADTEANNRIRRIYIKLSGN